MNRLEKKRRKKFIRENARVLKDPRTRRFSDMYEPRKKYRKLKWMWER